MSNDAVSVKIGTRNYPLYLSTNGMQEIKERFGDVYKAADKLSDATTTTFDRLGLAVALVSILATQGARAHNFNYPDEPRIPDLPEDIAGTILTIADLGNLTTKIQQAINIGVGRTVFSMPDDDEKN